MKKSAGVLISLLLMGLFILANPVSAASPKKTQLNFWSASPGGSWYPMAIAAGKIFESVPNLTLVHSPGGGVSNVQAIEQRKADMGITYSATAGDAMVAAAPFTEKAKRIRSLAGFNKTYLAFVTFKDSGIKKISDLKGKRVGVGKKGYSSEITCKMMLAAAGLTYNDLGKYEYVADEDADNLMKDGHLDAKITGLGVIAEPDIVDLSSHKPITILPVSDAEFAKIKAEHPGFIQATVPKGEYPGVDADVKVIGSVLGTLIAADVDETVAYNLAKALAERWVSDMHPVMATLKTVKPEDLAVNMGCPYHPGALKYYKEKGWIK